MATKKQANGDAGKTKALAKWDERLAKYAQAAVATEANTGAGVKSFSIKSGVLSLDDVPFKNNEMAVVILDHVIVRRYDEEEYDAENPAPPTCFAVDRVEEGMKPHATVFERGQEQNDACANCPHNAWGSAPKGRGKACRERRRLLCLSAGTINPRGGEFEFNSDPDNYKNGEFGFLNVPVTSTMAWAQYVKQLKSGTNLPPLAVVTHVKIVPDQKSNFKLEFQVLETIEDEAVLEAIMDRRDACEELVMQPLNLDAQESDERDQKPRGGAKPGKGNPKETAVDRLAARAKEKAKAKKATQAPAEAPARSRKY